MMVMKQMVSGENATNPKTLDDYYQQQFDSIYNNITNAKIKEAVLLASLYHCCINNATYDKVIIKYIEKLYAEYPENSNYRKTFDPFVKEVTEFNERIERGFSKQIKFVENGDNINTFKEVISKFKGKPLFVDFWFSSCSPCREEFKYNDALKPFLENNGIEILYVSIDRREKEWHNSIKYFDLAGNHIRAKKSFMKISITTMEWDRSLTI